MLNWLRRDPVEKLKKEYAQKLIEARDLQRKGDIKGSAAKSAEAEAILQKIDTVEVTKN